MKKIKLLITAFCLVAVLLFVVPTPTAYALDPQGTGNSAPKPPPPPTIDWVAIMAALIKII